MTLHACMVISLPLQTFSPSYGQWLTILISLLLVVLGVSREVLLVVGVTKFIATVVPSVVASDSDRDEMTVSGGQVVPVL